MNQYVTPRLGRTHFTMGDPRNVADAAVSLSRREALIKGCGGLAGMALAWMLKQEAASAHGQGEGAPPAQDLSPGVPHSLARAKSVILLFQGGGPSQVDLFDPKPALARHHGQEIPLEIFQRGIGFHKRLMASPFRFAQQGESGTVVSELLPHLAGVVDEIAVVRSCSTNRIDHDNAQFMFNTGRPVSGFPSFGSWACYGLGTENQSLPAYVALVGSLPNVRQRIWSSAWLPPIFQGTQIRAEGVPVFDLQRPEGVTEARQRKLIDFIHALNNRHRERLPAQSELEARIANFELAARMQTEVIQQIDISDEPEHIRRLYGLDQDHCRGYGRLCLLARKLVESGVRFVHVLRGDWDHHSQLQSKLTQSCLETDQPVAALLMDLKRRGLLDETLVIWSGEFGRLPIAERDGGGRDHNPHGFSLWMAGGGIRGGATFGATDDFGYAAVENVIMPSHIHATALHLLGLDYHRLTYFFEGRDESLVGVNQARVLGELLA